MIPSSLDFHVAGKASMAAVRTIPASTPLQPASMETAKPLAESQIIFPWDATSSSQSCISEALSRAIPVVKGGIPTASCAQGVNSAVKRTKTGQGNRKRSASCQFWGRRKGEVPGIGMRKWPTSFKNEYSRQDAKLVKIAPDRLVSWSANRGRRR
jgi:hypothetical protein